MSSKCFALFIVVLLLFTLPATATTIRVPADHPTIQAGIDAAVAGDTVLVANGVYVGSGNRDITFGGKAITVESEHGFTSCIIDCQSLGRGFQFVNDEGSDSILRGFTVRNGYMLADGGGIYCLHASPVIEANRIEGCISGDEGGGFYCTGGSPVIRQNLVTGCETDRAGGGICCEDCSPFIENNTIHGNSSSVFGGGIYCSVGSQAISGNSITDNNSDHGAGLCCFANGLVSRNSFIGNHGDLTGSALYCTGENLTYVTGNTFSENECDIFGGSITVGYGATAHIVNNTFTGNFGGDYGAIWFYAEEFGAYGTVSGNVMTGNSGGGSCVSFGLAITALDRSPAPHCPLPYPVGPTGDRGGEKLVINNFFVGNSGSAILHGELHHHGKLDRRGPAKLPGTADHHQLHHLRQHQRADPRQPIGDLQRYRGRLWRPDEHRRRPTLHPRAVGGLLLEPHGGWPGGRQPLHQHWKFPSE